MASQKRGIADYFFTIVLQFLDVESVSLERPTWLIKFQVVSLCLAVGEDFEVCPCLKPLARGLFSAPVAAPRFASLS